MRFLLKQILMNDGNIFENTKNVMKSLDNKEIMEAKKLIAPKIPKDDPAVVNLLKLINK